MKKTIMYSGDGEGRWWKREFPAQCPEEIFMSGQCQRAKGHDGDHWCYGGDGSYCWHSSRKDLKGCEISGGSTPAGHKSWIHPKNKRSECRVSCCVDHGEVTNKQVLSRLNRGELKDGESSNQPLEMGKLKPSVRKQIEKTEAK